MITLEQAKGLKVGDIIHQSDVYNADGTCKRWKVNGKTKLWKRNPRRIGIPIKHGLYSFGYLGEHSVKYFHLPEDKCS